MQIQLKRQTTKQLEDWLGNKFNVNYKMENKFNETIIIRHKLSKYNYPKETELFIKENYGKKFHAKRDNINFYLLENEKYYIHIYDCSSLKDFDKE